MPRKILATVLEVHCPNCGKPINIRLESGEYKHSISCWNCDAPIVAQNGYGENNIRVSCRGQRIRYNIIWQEKV